MNFDQDRLKVLSLVYESLLGYSNSGELAPILLSELPTLSANQLTYTFKLKAVPFHASSKLSAGRVVTSKDAIMSLLRGVSGDDSSNYGNLLSGLIDGLSSWKTSTESGEWYGKKLPSGIEIVTDSEFKIRLMRKYPDFLALLTLPAFSVQPHEAISGSSLTEAIGTGPYAFQDKNIENKDWALTGLATFKYPNVAVTESLDAETVKKSDYSSLNLKLAAEIIDPETSGLKAMPEHTLQELRVRRLELLVFNFQDPTIKGLGLDFRKSLLSLINADQLMSQMYRGFSLSSMQFIPPGVEGTLEKSPLKLYSKDEATKKIKKLLAKKKVKIIYPESAAYWIQQLQNDLQGLADHFEFESIDVSSYLARVEKGEYQIAPLSWEGDLPEATNYLQLYYSGNQKNEQNLSGYKSAAFDSVFDKLSKLFPSSERKKLAEEAHRIVLKDLPALPLGYKRDFIVLNQRAQGLNAKVFGASSLKDFLLAP
jgi:ABC-type oligopeptide transport system substrate-binding subunit